jgi:uncharacterized protein (TIGR01777 family)
MKILVSGASGLVGMRLVATLSIAGHSVRRLVRDRGKAASGDVYWNPASGEADAAAIRGFDAVVNLAGESIAARHWTQKRKHAILRSRVDGTRLVAEALSRPSEPRKILINASAIGYYGSRGDELLDETSRSGSGDFLSEVCRQWEAATEPAAKAGARVVLARFGVILSGEGGALKKMLLPFKLGLGGRVGDGRQYMSWVTLDDAVGAIMYCLTNDAFAGPVNVVSSDPVTNREFTRTLGFVLSKPTLFPLPAFAARALLGQMADELLLASQRVRPSRLLDGGYIFQFPWLEHALRHVLSRL